MKHIGCHTCITGGGRNGAMAEQILNHVNVDALFQEMGGEAMTQCVHGKTSERTPISCCSKGRRRRHPLTYAAGGLESAEIRKAVCDILEGGEAVFRERARRLRVRLEH